jgi:alcohol dehydrogenase class IV
LENGTVNAIVLPHALRFNATAAAAGLAKAAAALGLPPNDSELLLPKVVKAVQMIFGTLDLPPRLRDVGIPAEALPAIATTAMGDWFLRGNPRPVRDARELQDVLEAAW